MELYLLNFKNISTATLNSTQVVLYKKDINTSYLLLSYNIVYLWNYFRALNGINSKYEYCNIFTCSPIEASESCLVSVEGVKVFHYIGRAQICLQKFSTLSVPLLAHRFLSRKVIFRRVCLNSWIFQAKDLHLHILTTV